MQALQTPSEFAGQYCNAQVEIALLEHGIIVTPANRGRQLFTEQDREINKASCLATRINRFFGTDWDSVSEAYGGQPTNIIITCTDNIASRLFVQEVFQKKPKENRYIHPFEKLALLIKYTK